MCSVYLVIYYIFTEGLPEQGVDKTALRETRVCTLVVLKYSCGHTQEEQDLLRTWEALRGNEA